MIFVLTEKNFQNWKIMRLFIIKKKELKTERQRSSWDNSDVIKLGFQLVVWYLFWTLCYFNEDELIKSKNDNFHAWSHVHTTSIQNTRKEGRRGRKETMVWSWQENYTRYNYIEKINEPPSFRQRTCIWVWILEFWAERYLRRERNIIFKSDHLSVLA